MAGLHVADGAGLSEKDENARVLSKHSWMLRLNARTVITCQYRVFKFRVLTHRSKKECSMHARCEKRVEFQVGVHLDGRSGTPRHWWG